MLLAEKAADDIINLYQVTETTNTVPTSTTSANNINTTPSTSASILVEPYKLLLTLIFIFVAKMC